MLDGDEFWHLHFFAGSATLQVSEDCCLQLMPVDVTGVQPGRIKMKVSDVLKEKGARVMTVRPNETVRELVHRLRTERVGALVVSEDGRRMSGIVSERDLVGCLAEHGRKAPDVKVEEIMSSRVITCAPTDSLTAIARKMTDNRIRHLPVVEGGVLVGLVSIGDVVKLRLAEMELEANVLRDIAVASH